MPEGPELGSRNRAPRVHHPRRKCRWDWLGSNAFGVFDVPRGPTMTCCGVAPVIGIRYSHSHRWISTFFIRNRKSEKDLIPFRAKYVIVDPFSQRDNARHRNVAAASLALLHPLLGGHYLDDTIVITMKFSAVFTALCVASTGAFSPVTKAISRVRLSFSTEVQRCSIPILW